MQASPTENFASPVCNEIAIKKTTQLYEMKLRFSLLHVGDRQKQGSSREEGREGE